MDFRYLHTVLIMYNILSEVVLMKKYFYSIILLVLSFTVLYFSYTKLTGKYELLGIFFSGMLLGVFLMFLKLNVKNTKLNSYKRELEKESVSSLESSAKVKVLESKIQVLEKALENALKK